MEDEITIPGLLGDLLDPEAATEEATTEEEAADLTLDERYKKAIDFLNSEYPFWLTQVLNIGYPEWHEGVPTACVGLAKEEKDATKFRFMFGPKFARTLSVEEMAFILSHETMHIVLGHLKEIGEYDDKRRFNIATDCIINDWLAEAGMEDFIPEGGCRGEQIIGINCYGLKTREVYDLVPVNDIPTPKPERGEEESDEEEAEPTEGEEESEFSDGGEGGDVEDGGEDSEEESGDTEGSATSGDSDKEVDAWDAAKEATGDHDWMDEVAKDMAEDSTEEIDDALEEAADEARMEGLDPVTDKTEVGAEGGRAYAERHGISLKWVELLQEMDPDFLRENAKGKRKHYTWSRPDRRMMGMYPDTMLPTQGKDESHEFGPTDEKPQLVMFIDASGSVSQSQLKNFVAMAQSVPDDRIDLILVAAATSSKEVDLEKLKDGSLSSLPRVGHGNGPIPGFYASGGVCEFMAMQNWILRALETGRLKHYPKAVVAVSDGESVLLKEQITAEQAKSWKLLVESTGAARSGTRGIFKKEQIENLWNFTKKEA